MADKDPESDEAALELPSFGFGRRRRRQGVEASHPEVPATPDPGPEVSPGATPDVPAAPDRGPEVVPGATPEVPAAPEPGEAPAAPPEIDPLLPSRPPEPERSPEIDPLLPTPPTAREPVPEIDPLVPTAPETQPPSDPARVPAPEPPREPEPEPEPPAPEPEPEPAPEPEPQPGDHPTQVLPATPPTRRRTAPAEPAAARSTAARGSAALDIRDDSPAATPEPSLGRRAPAFPSLPALPAVLLVGAVVGLAAVLLTYGSLRLCDVATGTATCGGGPGLLMMLAIAIALTYLGGWLLRGLGIRDAGSTSFLAVALLAVVAMLFLVDSLDEWSGAVAVVLVTTVAYAASWRVTQTVVDAGAEQG